MGEGLAGLGNIPSPTVPNFDGITDPGQIAELAMQFQVDMMNFSAVNAAMNKAVDTMEKVVDRQAN